MHDCTLFTNNNLPEMLCLKKRQNFYLCEKQGCCALAMVSYSTCTVADSLANPMVYVLSRVSWDMIGTCAYIVVSGN